MSKSRGGVGENLGGEPIPVSMQTHPKFTLALLLTAALPLAARAQHDTHRLTDGGDYYLLEDDLKLGVTLEMAFEEDWVDPAARAAPAPSEFVADAAATAPTEDDFKTRSARPAQFGPIC